LGLLIFQTTGNIRMKTKSVSPRRRHYMAAMVLGTALSALGSGQATAATASEISPGDINHVNRYCTACWRNAHLPVDRWPDCTQEVFRRLLERVEPADWGQLLNRETEERRELIRAIDAVKKSTIRESKRTGPLLGVVADHRGMQEGKLAEDREAVAFAADQILSPRQQSILKLACAGYSVQDIAQELGLSPERVSDEKYKAIRKLRDHFHPVMGETGA
jgi:RNA polymerase sigma factor (sigma-70 family)